ncbi:hypothetical protein PQO03_21005 [Lentisphaera profundi]|uniref:Uncharacterized protein n=1 Tax=Lentisphaera profundi TaxID=1658616 RepID=A0ABY7W1Y5_9BACT|nr:hypothetical protein [Lentisphaera profundi]WDE98293.1 hypothetical protein PQO03_21005 [Lentisphaera profundi]
MEKKHQSNWKKWVLLVILGALTLEPSFLGVLNGQDDDFDKELKLADLKIRNFELRKELEELKSVKVKMQEDLLNKGKQLAVIEQDLALISADVKAEDVNVVLLKELSLCRNAIVALERKQDEFREYGRKALSSLKAEKILLEEYDNKAALVNQELKIVKNTVFAVKEEGAAYVLKLDAELNVLAMSQGYAQGVVQGSDWNVTVNDRKVATIKIIEARRNSSLALIIEGSAKDIKPGSSKVSKR